MIALSDQIKCVMREIAMRERVYGKWVESGRMNQDAADREIAAMKAVLVTLRNVEAAEKQGKGQ